jgi:hypothetical protein
MPVIFEFECPHCGTEMKGTFVGNVYCPNCDLSFETDSDGNDDNFDAWLTGKEFKGKIDISNID